MRKIFLFIVLFACSCGRTVYDVSDFGVKAGAGTDNSEAVIFTLTMPMRGLSLFPIMTSPIRRGW